MDGWVTSRVIESGHLTYVLVQLIAEKVRPKMVIRIQIRILIKRYLFKRLIWKETWNLTIEDSVLDSDDYFGSHPFCNGLYQLFSHTLVLTHRVLTHTYTKAMWHDMTHSRVTWLNYMGHDSFIWDMTHMGYYSYGTWLIYMWYDSYGTWLIWDIPHLYVIWYIYDWVTDGMTHMGHDSYGTGLIYMWYDSYGTWLICDMICKRLSHWWSR